MKINMGYCLWYTIVAGLGTFQTSFSLTGNANTTPIFQAKFGWDKDEKLFYNTLFSAASVIGIAVGSFLGGSLLRLGRRKTAIIS